jgi:chemotaxis protein methyltransferase CheR
MSDRVELETGREKVEEIELQLLLAGLHRHHGVDFRDYARASLKRRVLSWMREDGLRTISGLQEKVLHDPAYEERLIEALTVRVSAMFRDAGFYGAIREHVVPIIRTYPFIRIWHAGCAGGEEVYSLAILLTEEGIYDRCRIYATDLNQAGLRVAQAGAFPLAAMRDNSVNYLKAGCHSSLSDYYVARADVAVFDPGLRKNVVFARHNLASEASFNEFNVILCRNVMIYFNRTLQERVHGLLYSSLGMFGFLGLGNRESIRFSPHESRYQTVHAQDRIYRKIQ